MHLCVTKFDEGLNFELGKKAFDDKSGLYTYISFHIPPPMYLEKIEEHVSEGDTIEVLIAMTQRDKIRFKRHEDCETGCRNIHSDPENLMESQTHESYSHELIPGVI